MPSRKTLNGQHKDIAHPINSDTRKKIEDAIFEKYNAPETEEAVQEVNAEDSAE